MEKEVKITGKFIFKLIVWLIIITIIGAIVVFMVNSGNFEQADVDDEEAMKTIKGLVYGLVAVDVIAALLGTKLALSGSLKKITVTDENKGKIFKNVTIVLIAFTVIVGLLHGLVINALNESFAEDSDIDLEELKDDVDEYVEDHYLAEDEEEIVKEFNDFLGMEKVYTFDCIAFLVMIPISKVIIDKKSKKEVTE